MLGHCRAPKMRRADLDTKLAPIHAAVNQTTPADHLGTGWLLLVVFIGS